jgi:hypothetical protein
MGTDNIIDGIPADPLPPDIEEGEPDTKDDEFAQPDAPDQPADEAYDGD